ncbi:LAQU0S27e00100g1_1 [Lachancea quebecensis]|uniref:LAQU0S27e00100g1_1 n=1 Tax=Lachancea quebecensis TaxID=1654605 RepID=A0A0P1L034_9SACH|nr:LAQU0S27e00100g1_1 [Lachancea quebecensis]
MEDKGNSRKALRSCVRCRKNKIKCDLQDRRPGSCSPCSRRGIECSVDYVVPHQRSQELINLFQNVEEVKRCMGSLASNYEKFAREHVPHCSERMKDISSSVGSKVLKLDDGEFIIVCLRAEGLLVNNYLIERVDIEHTLKEFQEVVGTLLQLYERPDCGRSCVNESVIDESVGKYTVENLFHSEQLPFLLCMVNFYFEVPGLEYNKLFDRILNDYCFMATEDEKRGKTFDRRTLSKLIIGNSNNDTSFLFNGEMFIKKFTLYLFYHIVIYGVGHYMEAFMDKYIRTLENVRKKVNIEKNWEVKWVNFYIKVFGLMDRMEEVLDLGEENDPFLKLLEYDSRILQNEKLIEGKFECFMEQCYYDMEPLLRRGSYRVPFVKEFMAQFLTLNFFVADVWFKTSLKEMEGMKYTGFNRYITFDDSPNLDLEEPSVNNKIKESECTYEVGKCNGVNDEVYEGGSAKKEMCAKVRKVRFEERDACDVIVCCLTKTGYNEVLNRSSCGLIRDMCEKVILEGMIMKL